MTAPKYLQQVIPELKDCVQFMENLQRNESYSAADLRRIRKQLMDVVDFVDGHFPKQKDMVGGMA